MEASCCQVMDGWQPEAGNNVAITLCCVRCVAYVILRLIENLCNAESGSVGCYFSSALNYFYTLCLDCFQVTH